MAVISDYVFLLLVQLSRAGTQKLKHRLEAQMKIIQEKSLSVTERLAVKESVSSEHQAQFYSQWYYVAVHVLLTIEKFQTKDSMAGYLGLSLKKISEILDFLISISMVEKKGNLYKVGSSRVHLNANSPMISKHHTNWRIQAIKSLEYEVLEQDLHYSSVMSIANADIVQIKSLFLKAIENSNKIVKESKEEILYSFCLDFFKV